MSEELCVICFENIETKGCTRLSCKHTYHSDCLYNYMYFKLKQALDGGFRLGHTQKLNTLRCPLCRRININSIQRTLRFDITQTQGKVKEMKKSVSSTTKLYTFEKWSFRIIYMFRQPTKMEVFQYLQNESEIQDAICGMELSIKALQHQNDKIRFISDFIRSC